MLSELEIFPFACRSLLWKGFGSFAMLSLSARLRVPLAAPTLKFKAFVEESALALSVVEGAFSLSSKSLKGSDWEGAGTALEATRPTRLEAAAAFLREGVFSISPARAACIPEVSASYSRLRRCSTKGRQMLLCGR